MALKDRIDVLNGLTNTAATVTNLLNLEAPAHIRYIPDDIVRLFTSALTDAGSGVALNKNARVVFAHKSGRRAQLRDAADKAYLTDTNSLHLATTLTPAFYQENATAYVLPGGGTVVAVVPTTLNSSSDDDISFLPAALSDAVQVKVAWRLLAAAIFSNTAPYDRPTAPSIAYVPAGFAQMATAALSGLAAYSAWNTTTLGANNTALTADDIEIADGQLRRGAQQLEALQTDLQSLVAKYQEDARNETNVDLQNQIQASQVALQNYSLSVQRYQGQVAAGLQMLQSLYQQYISIMEPFTRSEVKAVQKTSSKQPVEAMA